MTNYTFEVIWSIQVDCTIKLISFIGTCLRAAGRLITSLRYEEALAEADDSGFCFTTATTGELQHALEALTQHENEGRVGEVDEEEMIEEEVIYDWEELEDE